MSFECCEPEKKTRPYQLWKHSKHWRLHAQGLVRQIPTPCKPPQFGVLGIDNDGVAAAAFFELDVTWHINVAAVALRWQGQRLGDQLMNRVFSRIIEHADEHGVKSSIISARAHPDNRESIALLERSGFVLVPEPESEGFPLWATRIPTNL